MLFICIHIHRGIIHRHHNSNTFAVLIYKERIQLYYKR